MIEIKNVSFAYDEKDVLKNISFKVDPAESVVIMGPSGSGKSTVLRLILGLECPQLGCIYVDGQNICKMKEKEKQKIRKKIGMVFQDGALFDSLSVWENVAYYLLEHSKLPVNEIGDKAIQMLGFVGLDADEIMYKLPEHLSGGMQRRVAIGRALLSTDPSVMLYDEPTTGLDPQATEKIIKLIMKLQSEKELSTIVVTHQIADAIGIANRFIVIVDGELAFDGNLEELRDSKDVRVIKFLKPFKASFDDVKNKKFIA